VLRYPPRYGRIIARRINWTGRPIPSFTDVP